MSDSKKEKVQEQTKIEITVCTVPHEMKQVVTER